MATQQMPPGAPGGQPVQLTPEQLQQHQMQMAMALEQQKQMNLDRALTLPSLDDEPFQALPIGINREDHQLTLVSETAAADTTRLVNAFEPALHPTPEQAVAKVNLLAELFKAAPDGAIPPPPQNIDRNRSGAVNKYKEDGNTNFKAKKYRESITNYTQALMIAAGRMPWETQLILRDELAIVLCNRAAAYGAIFEWTASYADADTVIRLKRPWSKGHFRKAKALLGLARPYDAREAVSLGLEFEPNSAELLAFRDEINAVIAKQEADEDAEDERERTAGQEQPVDMQSTD